MKKIQNFTNQHWPKLLSVFFFIILLSAYANIFAIFSPGQTLNPNCAPGVSGCTVSTTAIPSGSDSQIQFNNNGIFGSSSGLTWVQGSGPFSVGSDVVFTKDDYETTSATPPTDNISQYVHIARNSVKSIYNAVNESFYDWNDNLAPTGTEWNSDGWGDLSDADTRSYTTFYNAVGGSIGNNIIGKELIMHDIQDDKYYKFEFTSWSSNDNGGTGGFAYTRNLINLSPYSLGSDVDFNRPDTVLTPPTDNISTSVHLTRGESKGLYNAVNESFYDWDESLAPTGTEWNSDGWGDLSDVSTRSYVTFRDALGGNVGNNILNSELVMHDIVQDKYYKFRFTSWTSSDTGAGGGGFSYVRNSINLEVPSKLSVLGNLLIGGDNKYLNFGVDAGISGYGFRDNGGVLEYKNLSGDWTGIGGGTSSSPITINNSSSLFSTGLSGSGAGSSATDSIFLGVSAGEGATNISGSNFLGNSAGALSEDANYSNFFGQSAGYSASNAYHSNFLGDNAGRGATNADNSNFMGTQSGYNASQSSGSNFLGNLSGAFATNAFFSNFIGQDSGYTATNASHSNFIGYNSGYGATNARNSIFIGNSSGMNDTVDNTLNFDDWSILLGYNTKTGGFKNSILLGGSNSTTPISNTKANQFMLAPSVTEMRLRGIDYSLPSSQGGASTVLTNDGSGVLSWTSVSGGGGGFSSDADFNTKGGTGAGANLVSGAEKNTLVGYQAGMGGAVTNAADYNTAIGYRTLYSNTTGSNNTAIGLSSLFSNTTGYSNTANGYNSLLSNTTGFNNTAIGLTSLFFNTTGNNNTAIGLQSLYSNTTGSYNVSSGISSLYYNTTGNNNIASGNNSLHDNTIGSYNVAYGMQSLYSNKANNRNTAIGYNSMYYADDRTSGRDTFNTAIGYEALRGGTTAANNTGSENTAVGDSTLWSNTSGFGNTAVGRNSLLFNTTGNFNTAIGSGSLGSNTTGNNNTANGTSSLSLSTTGYNNVAFGYQSGLYIANGSTPNQTSSNSLYLGFSTKALTDGDTNEVVIGASAIGNGSNTATIGNSSLLRTYLTGVNLKSGTATAGTAPLKFTAGTNLGTTEAGAVEYDGNHLYFTATNGGSRYQLDQQGSNYVPYNGATSDLNLDAHNLSLNGAHIQMNGASGQNYINIENAGAKMTYNMDSIKYTSNQFGGTKRVSLFTTASTGTDYNINFPDASGTVALTSNIPTFPITVVNSSNLFSTAFTNTGRFVTATDDSIFLSNYAGNNATNASNSIFMGYSSGNSATNAYRSNFLGYYTGNGAVNASNSNFLGYFAGSNANDASNSIFIGQYAGTSDTVNNTTNTDDFSILIGKSTSTGGFSNSIAIGGSAVNTASSQLTIGSATRPINKLYIAGVNYDLPTSQGGASTVLTNNGSGGLTWSAVSGGLTSDADFNTKGGTNAGLNLVSGAQFNTFLGYEAGKSASSGGTNGADYNTATGYQSFYSNTTGFNNTANGYQSLYSNTTGYYNTANGYKSLFYNTSGSYNTAIGETSLLRNTTGSNNTASGHASLWSNTTGISNTANGMYSLYSNTTGYDNTADGLQSLLSNTTGYYNTAIGNYSLRANTTGIRNSALGHEAGRYLANGSTDRTTGDYGLYLGDNSKASADGTSNEIVIGASAIGNGSNTATIGNASILRTYLTGLNLKAGTATSGTAPLKFTAGTNLGTPESGVMEYNNDFYLTPSTGVRYKIPLIVGTDYQAPLVSGTNIKTINSTSLLGGGDISIASSPVTLVNANNLFSSSIAGGAGVTTSTYSNFLGYLAGASATGASNSNFLGHNAGSGATNASSSNFFGDSAGQNSASAFNSNFFGDSAGSSSSSASYSNFLGYAAGSSATSAYNSNFFGAMAGYSATNASYSIFMGYRAGFGAINSAGSNFLGIYAGDTATSAPNSNFIGNNAGYKATSAAASNFIGLNAGYQAANASGSIFIGTNAGNSDTVDNTTNSDDFSILIGTSTRTGGFKNSIALGGSAVNTATNQFMIGSTTRPIDTTRWNGSSSTQCTLTTGTGIACTSDERLKTDITDLSSDTLDKLTKVKTVNFKWLEGDNTTNNIGFLAQDLEQYFPELVATDSQGYKSVYYASMTPILTEAIRELGLKVEDLSSLDTSSSTSFGSLVKDFLSNAENTISNLYATIIHSDRVETKELCVGTTCVTESQFLQMVQNANVNTNNSSGSSSSEVITTPTIPPAEVEPEPNTDSTTTSDNNTPSDSSAELSDTTQKDVPPESTQNAETQSSPSASTETQTQ